MAMPHIKPGHKGMLHQQLGVPADEPISMGELMEAKTKAAKTGNTKLMRRATFAANARKWGKK